MIGKTWHWHWENITTDYNVTVRIFAVDNGKPRRGDYYDVTVKYQKSCDLAGNIVVNETDGRVHFSAPGMTTWDKKKHRHSEFAHDAHRSITFIL